MFGIGMPELILIFFIALIILGPRELPEVARGIGKGLRAFKHALHAPAEETPSEENERAESEERMDAPTDEQVHDEANSGKGDTA